MNLIRKGHGHAHRGIIGIESAIVLIAFVIVAAALAFVVLNMGFSTTQKAKTAIIAAVEEAGSSMEVAGKIIGIGDIQPSVLNTTNIPIKIVSGGATVNLDGNSSNIKFISDNREYDNIYTYGPLHIGEYLNSTIAWEVAENKGWICNNCNPVNASAPNATVAIIYWTVNKNNNTILDIGEYIVASVAFAENDRPASLEHMAIEILVPKGAPLTVDRTVPNITTEVVDLG